MTGIYSEGIQIPMSSLKVGFHYISPRHVKPLHFFNPDMHRPAEHARRRALTALFRFSWTERSSCTACIFATRQDEKANKAILPTLKSKPIIHFRTRGSPNSGVSQIALHAAVWEFFSSPWSQIRLTTLEEKPLSLKPHAPLCQVHRQLAKVSERKNAREKAFLVRQIILCNIIGVLVGWLVPFAPLMRLGKRSCEDAPLMVCFDCD